MKESKYVVHKKTFFFNDEAYEAIETEQGSIVGIYKTIERARIAKKQADIESMRNCGGHDIDDYIFYRENKEQIKEELREYYEEELKQKINDNYYTFPQKINEEMAMDFLEILEFSFHIIMEYSEEKEIRLLSKKDKTSDFFEL